MKFVLSSPEPVLTACSEDGGELKFFFMKPRSNRYASRRSLLAGTDAASASVESRARAQNAQAEYGIMSLY
jgi:hypothetical protein